MAKSATAEAPKLTAEELREKIANQPRQSQVRKVQYVAILDAAAPGKADELIAPDELDAIREVVDKVANPLEAAIAKVTDKQVEIAVTALTNEDEKNGYANFAFDFDAFTEKTRVKTPRARKPVEERIDINALSDEEAATLAALLAQRG